MAGLLRVAGKHPLILAGVVGLGYVGFKYLQAHVKGLYAATEAEEVFFSHLVAEADHDSAGILVEDVCEGESQDLGEDLGPTRDNVDLEFEELVPIPPGGDVKRRVRTRKRRVDLVGAVALARQSVVARMGTMTDSPANRLVSQRLVLEYLKERKVRPYDVIRILPLAVELCFVPTNIEIMARKLRVSRAAYERQVAILNVSPRRGTLARMLKVPREIVSRALGVQCPTEGSSCT